MADGLHRRIVQNALERGGEEVEVRMMRGELILYHTLLQDYGLELVQEAQFIPLLERSVARINSN